ncbi:MAG: hypothetical protein BWY17_05165 [Deltaproteobacteria bacterium ADurb.Bin207]|nr:MAG: hypothetical protein BWY17_05165 [Deltaproteobacteria bacterium ADurb.Bin207]
MAAKCTAQQCAEIPCLAQEVGPLEAAKRKGVTPGTVTAWRCLEKKSKTRQAPRATKTRGIGTSQTTCWQKSCRLYTPSEKAAALELVQQLAIIEIHRKQVFIAFMCTNGLASMKKPCSKSTSPTPSPTRPLPKTTATLVFAPTFRGIAPTRRGFLETRRGIVQS